jgi:Fe-S oxidoreductase
VDIRGLAAEISKGHYGAAAKLLRKVVPFPRIIARICDQPCQPPCNRIDLGGAIQVAALEEACLRFSPEPPGKISVFPPKGKRVAIVGGGLSGLTAAFDLAKKGYTPVIFDAEERLGGRIWEAPDTILPRQAIEEDLAVLAELKIECRLKTRIGKDVSLDDLLKRYDAVYLGLGGCDEPAEFGLACDQDGRVLVDPLTFNTGRAQIFAGGALLHPYSPILSISDGRRAAISIDRYLQKVSLTASRANEGAYPSRLVTRTERIEPIEAIRMADSASGYTREEAVSEAGRCILCECMECVKVCEYLAQYRSYPKKYVREIYNNLTLIMRARNANQMINSCTLCGLCKEVCPEGLDMGAVCREARQTMVETGKMPPSAHDFAMRDMAFSNSEAFALSMSPPDGNRCESVFFPGCQLAACDPEIVHSVYGDLTARLPGVGILLGCCGAPADWAGENAIYQETVVDLERQIRDLGSPRVILACPSCYQVFKRNLPGLSIVSLWEILDQIGLPENASPHPAGPLVLHDPCSARHEKGIQDSARSLLNRMGVSFTEPSFTRETTECCGYGGLTWLANPDMAEKIIRRRIQEQGADYITYCAMCRDFFAGQGKPTLHILDLIYGKENQAARKGPGYSQRHENRARLKRELLGQQARRGDETMDESAAIRLKISSEVRETLESRLILDEDIQRAIENAEKNGSKFIHSGTGHTLGFYRPANITYWIEYLSKEGEYTIFNAYSHRMEIGEKGSA